MPRKNVRALSAMSVSCLILLSLSGCGDRGPVLKVTADTSCERYRYIPASEEQIEVMTKNWQVMKPYAQQVAAHNVTYTKNCLLPKGE